MKRKMCLGGGLLLIASSAIISLAACSSFNLHSDNVIRNADGTVFTATKVFNTNDVDTSNSKIKPFEIKDVNDSTSSGFNISSILNYRTTNKFIKFDGASAGVHIGSSNSTISSINFSSNFDATTIVVKSVSIECYSAATVKLGVKDGESEFLTEDRKNSVSLVSESTVYTFYNQDSLSFGDMSIDLTCSTSKKAIYIKSISLKYSVSDAVSHSVKFMNGESVFDTKYVASGHKVSSPSENPTKLDYNCYSYTFEGWKNADGELYNFESEVTTDIVLYSSFKENVKSTKELLDLSYKTSSIDFSYQYKKNGVIANSEISLINPTNTTLPTVENFELTKVTADDSNSNYYYKFNNVDSSISHIFAYSYETLEISFKYGITGTSSTFSTLYLDAIDKLGNPVKRIATYTTDKAISAGSSPVSISLDDISGKNVHGIKFTTNKVSGSNASVRDLTLSGTYYEDPSISIRNVENINIQYTGSTGLVENGSVVKYEDLSNFEKIGVIATTDSSLISSATDALPTENSYSKEFSLENLTYRCGLRIPNAEIKDKYETAYYFATYALKDGKYYYSTPLETSIKDELANRDLVSAELEEAFKAYFEIA